MILLGYYLLKVIACSALLFGYYYLALRNKVFHQWNRYYLLATVLLSLLLPFIQFNVQEPESGPAYGFLQVVNTTDDFVVQVSHTTSTTFNYQPIVMIAYLLVSAILLTGLVASVYKIRSIIRQHSKQNIHGIHLIYSKANGTPFSFLNYIFWNPQIDINTDTGKQILAHEIVHVKEKHTLDKLFINLLLIPFWCNPVFWLIRHELKMIHEFIADKKSVEDGDTSVLSAMILHAAYPKAYSQIANSFFQQTIKRRLLMLAKIKNPRISYWSRIIALPLLVFVSLAFTLKSNSNTTGNTVFTTDTIPKNNNKVETKDVVLEDIEIKDLILEEILKPAGKNGKPETEEELKIDANGNPIIIKDIILDTIPNKQKMGKVLKVDFTRSDKAWIFFENGLQITSIEDAVSNKYITQAEAQSLLQKIKGGTHPLVVKDGKEDPTLTESNVDLIYKGNKEVTIQKLNKAEATKLYGAKGDNGAIVITTNNANYNRDQNIVFTRVENEPMFPGGSDAWISYLSKNVNSMVPVNNKAPKGTYNVIVQFIVTKDGELKDIKPVTKLGYGMEDEVIRIISKGPKWEPAKQNGHEVSAYHKQVVTFIVGS